MSANEADLPKYNDLEQRYYAANQIERRTRHSCSPITFCDGDRLLWRSFTVGNQQRSFYG